MENNVKKYSIEDLIQKTNHLFKHGYSLYKCYGELAEHTKGVLIECLKADKEGVDLHQLPLSVDIMRELCTNYKLPEEFIEKYEDLFEWKQISMYQHLSEPFMRKYIDKLDMEEICCKQTLSEQFVRDYFDKLDKKCWTYISENHHSNFSESFIREFKDQLEWCFLSYQYDFTPEFVREMSDKIYYNHFCCNKKKYIKNEKEFICKNDKVSDYKLIHLKKALSL